MRRDIRPACRPRRARGGTCQEECDSRAVSPFWPLALKDSSSLPLAGGELDQIQFLLGHSSIQTTERYLGTRQNLAQAVNDDIL